MLDLLRQDVRYAIRALGRSPLFALVSVLSIAIGVGATTGIVTLVNTLLLRPPPGVALGAQRSHVLGLVLRQGVVLAAGGVVVGSLAAAGATRLIANLLYGVPPTDVFAFGGRPWRLRWRRWRRVGFLRGERRALTPSPRSGASRSGARVVIPNEVRNPWPPDRESRIPHFVRNDDWRAGQTQSSGKPGNRTPYV
jgi:hypothetical protein